LQLCIILGFIMK